MPDKESTVHLKDHEQAKLENPFAPKLKETKERRKEKEKEKEKVRASKVWDPSFEASDAIEEGSAVSLVNSTATSTSTRQKLDEKRLTLSY